MRATLCLTVLVTCALTSTVHAESAATLYVLAIGYNGVPPNTTDSLLRQLRYADDDAAAFAELAKDLGAVTIVLSDFDRDTARRFPELMKDVRPPTHGELTRAVRELSARIDRDRAQGKESNILVTYSGHGTVESGIAALTLADGSLAHEGLYSEVLTQLHASFVHLVVDACHAEAVVRPRDVQAELVTLTADEAASHLAQTTLRGLPRVGALIASSASMQTHEWDVWQHGVFAHEVVSGLRGAADVNGDLRIEYSEMAAFLSAANREVRERGARVKPVITAPSAAPHTPLVVLRASTLSAFLVGDAAPLGRISIETEEGQLVLHLRSEPRHYVRVLIPSRRRLFVRTRDGETELTASAGQHVPFAALAMKKDASRARGSLALSLQRGAFATAYGPAYYRGFVDRADEPAGIPLVTNYASLRPPPAPADSGSSRAPAWVTLGVAGALLSTSGAFGLVALDAKEDFSDAKGLERASFAASERFNTSRSFSLGALVAGALAGGLSLVLFTTD